MKKNEGLISFQRTLERELDISVELKSIKESEGVISFLVVSDTFAKMSFRLKMEAIKIAKKTAAAQTDKFLWATCITTVDYAKNEVIESAIRSFESLDERASA